MDCFNYATQNNIQNAEVVQEIKNDFNLVDPWRIYHPNDNKYTWNRKNPIKQARLDFFLISEELMTMVERVDIIPGYRTDHAIIKLELRVTEMERGKGVWRFNNSLLRDQVYVKKKLKIS